MHRSHAGNHHNSYWSRPSSRQHPKEAAIEFTVHEWEHPDFQAATRPVKAPGIPVRADWSASVQLANSYTVQVIDCATSVLSGQVPQVTD